MYTHVRRLISILVLAASLCATIVAGAWAATPVMQTGGYTKQPIGHALFCRKFRHECNVRSRDRRATHLTRKRWAELLRINNSANREIMPVTDLDGYGVQEHWTYPASYGDCEDYVLLKRHMLMKRGWPASSLLITVVLQPNGEGHAVLTVRTDRGDFILDNLVTKVKRWDATPYRYLKRQSEHHSGRWTSIRDTRTKVASY